LPAALVWESDDSLRDALMHTLANRGYRVVVARTLAAAQQLLAQGHFDRVFGSLESLAERSRSADGAGPCVKDLRNGTARIHLDQVVPWSTAIDLLDVVSTATATPRHS
jgi:CheY-like chemotaxis protein